jgi:hypothetical protein
MARRRRSAKKSERRREVAERNSEEREMETLLDGVFTVVYPYLSS